MNMNLAILCKVERLSVWNVKRSQTQHHTTKVLRFTSYRPKSLAANKTKPNETFEY